MIIFDLFSIGFRKLHSGYQSSVKRHIGTLLITHNRETVTEGFPGNSSLFIYFWAYEEEKYYEVLSD